MAVILRPYQEALKAKVYAAWEGGARNVVMVMATGGGKTAVMCDMVAHHPGYSCLIAHRSELVSQISMMLARYGVPHNIIAADGTRRAIAAAHVAEFGRCFYTPSARCAVASIDTLVRATGLEAWAKQVTLFINDEGHHVVIGNKWHAGISIFTHPQCRGLLPTATPARSDGKGLGRPDLGGSGIADALVEGPPMRWLIEQGHLTKYRVICVESDLRKLIEQEKVGKDGDWSSQAGRKASEKSAIVGDVVENYLKWVPGQRHITFTTDVDTAMRMTNAYRLRGVRAECLTGKTHDHVRRDIIKRFERGDLEEIVAVDIISEGFDLPAIEACSFARPSQSKAVVWQQFGRTLRQFPGKTIATIIDHVSNVINPAIGLPTRPEKWTLADRDKRGSGATDAIPMRVCPGCSGPYERIYKSCPYCGYYIEPAGRSAPEMVDGDMAEMSPELVAKLNGDIAEADRSLDDERARLVATGLHHVGVLAGVKHHAERLQTFGALREAMALWGGRRRVEGRSDSEMQREFYHRFGVDVATAQTLRRADAQALLDRIVRAD